MPLEGGHAEETSDRGGLVAPRAARISPIPERHREREQHAHGDAAAKRVDRGAEQEPELRIGFAEDLADDPRDGVSEDENAAEETRPAKAEAAYRIGHDEEEQEPSPNAS